jgi:hypothetical protein
MDEARAENGVVALRVSGCDYYLIATSGGFVLAEWYGGFDPSRGDRVVGSFNTYGFKTVFLFPACGKVAFTSKITGSIGRALWNNFLRYATNLPLGG